MRGRPRSWNCGDFTSPRSKIQRCYNVQRLGLVGSNEHSVMSGFPVTHNQLNQFKRASHIKHSTHQCGWYATRGVSSITGVHWRNLSRAKAVDRHKNADSKFIWEKKQESHKRVALFFVTRSLSCRFNQEVSVKCLKLNVILSPSLTEYLWGYFIMLIWWALCTNSNNRSCWLW